jgi:chemotaxis protein MotB
VIAGAAGALAAVLLLVFVLPLRSNVSALQADKQQALADVEALTAARDELDAAHDVLEGRVASLELEKAELATEKAIAEQAMEAMRHTQTELEEQLAEEVKKGNVSITESHGELVVDLIDKIVFDSGESELNDRGKEVLRQVGETLKKVPDKVILITGHTDNLPMSEKLIEQFPTNWELSTARATNVVRFLQDEIKVPGKRLGIAGFGEFRPISNNRTKAGRRRNRRIEVRLLPLRGAAK